MSSKSSVDFKLGRTIGLLAAVFVVVLSACAPGAGSLGALTPIAGSAVATGTQPSAIAISD
jgi:hypothetical protein